MPGLIAVHRGGRVAGAVALALAFAGASSLAGPGVPPSYGHDFVTITHAGNRPALNSERFYGFLGWFPTLGQVNYEYRIARTETTVSQWFDFVNVAWPIAQAAGFSTRGDSSFLGRYIEATSANPNNPPNYYIVGPDPFGRHADNVATGMSLRFAAWYANWLHNGRPTTNVTAETFTTGAYNVDTLTVQPGARYWIPTLHEWTKAVYYDPDRDGPGQEGYWPYSGMSTTQLVGGPPGTPGAQTSAGAWYLPGTHGLPPDVGSYPQTVSPWGLLDTSGGVAEYTSTRDWLGQPGWIYRGDAYSSGGGINYDKIDELFLLSSLDGGGASVGLRIASLVPAPGSTFALAFSVVLPSIGRRRRMT